MTWRVVCKYRYHELFFDFATLDEAGEFAKTMLTHYKGDDDGETDCVRLSIQLVKEEAEA